MTKEEQLVVEFFKTFGYIAEKISESNEKSPDFIIENDGKKILIELKSKYDSDELLKKREIDLNLNGHHSHSTSMLRSNTISGIIKEGALQLDTLNQKINADECYLFFLSLGQFSHIFNNIYSTLYGIMKISSDYNNEPIVKECFYYTFNDFYDYPSIDGAFIYNLNSLKLCINTFSKKYSLIKNSKFVTTFNKCLIDPLEKEKSGEIYVIDSSFINRNNYDELNKYLIDKYKLKNIICLPFTNYTLESTFSIE